MPTPITDAELEGYIDEAVDAEMMSRIELALRNDPDLLQRFETIISQRDHGVHSLAAIWRRHQLSCFSREDLGSYLLGVLDPEAEDFIDLHLNVTGCRICQANIDDLKKRSEASEPTAQSRRQKYFQSSAGYLK